MRNYLLEFRKSIGLSQQAVADKIGTTNQNYSLFETGQRARSGLNTSMIGKFALVFGVTPEEILRLEAEYQAERASVLQAQGITTQRKGGIP